jgi:GTP-binding protein Era
MTGRKVFLELRVKVEKNWRDNPEALKRLGFFEAE